MNITTLVNSFVLWILLSNAMLFAQSSERYTKSELKDLVEYCNDEMNKHPQDIRYKLSRAEAYFLLKEYDNSLKDYLDIYKLDNKNVQVTYAIATIYNHKNMFSNSIKFYNITITNSPKEINAFYGRGTSYLEMKKYDLAIKDLSYCIKLNPNYFNGYYNRALAYLEIDSLDLAEKDLFYLLDNNKSTAEALSIIGLVNFKKGQYQLAIKNLEESISIDSNYYLSYKNMSMVYFAINDQVKGCTYLKKARDLGLIDNSKDCR